jgi:hypothetical protein
MAPVSVGAKPAGPLGLAGASSEAIKIPAATRKHPKALSLLQVSNLLVDASVRLEFISVRPYWCV